jgi:hypothetical protein
LYIKEDRYRLLIFVACLFQIGFKACAADNRGKPADYEWLKQQSHLSQHHAVTFDPKKRAKVEEEDHYQNLPPMNWSGKSKIIIGSCCVVVGVIAYTYVYYYRPRNNVANPFAKEMIRR